MARPPTPPAKRARAVRAYMAGASSTSVAKRYKVSPASVIQWVREAGHKPRNRGGKEPQEDLTYRGGWVNRGGVMYPLLPEQRSA